jgi:protocatechuate 3,4-dioxygenase, beta subunit
MVSYKSDGKTPAPNGILYMYHTDETGHYPTKGHEKGWAKRHGYLCGWMRTNAKGEYKFVTLRPAPYPARNEPAHIHLIVNEPGVSEYYVEDYLFADDPLLTAERQSKLSHQGVSGVLHLKDVGNRYKASGTFTSERTF